MHGTAKWPALLRAVGLHEVAPRGWQGSLWRALTWCCATKCNARDSQPLECTAASLVPYMALMPR
jgi:hypothetical protein